MMSVDRSLHPSARLLSIVFGCAVIAIGVVGFVPSPVFAGDPTHGKNCAPLLNPESLMLEQLFAEVSEEELQAAKTRAYLETREVGHRDLGNGFTEILPDSKTLLGRFAGTANRRLGYKLVIDSNLKSRSNGLHDPKRKWVFLNERLLKTGGRSMESTFTHELVHAALLSQIKLGQRPILASRIVVTGQNEAMTRLFPAMASLELYDTLRQVPLDELKAHLHSAQSELKRATFIKDPALRDRHVDSAFKSLSVGHKISIAHNDATDLVLSHIQKLTQGSQAPTLPVKFDAVLALENDVIFRGTFKMPTWEYQFLMPKTLNGTPQEKAVQQIQTIHELTESYRTDLFQMLMKDPTDIPPERLHQQVIEILRKFNRAVRKIDGREIPVTPGRAAPQPE